MVGAHGVDQHARLERPTHMVIELAVQQPEGPGEVVAGSLGDDAEHGVGLGDRPHRDAHQAIAASGCRIAEDVDGLHGGHRRRPRFNR